MVNGEKPIGLHKKQPGAVKPDCAQSPEQQMYTHLGSEATTFVFLSRDLAEIEVNLPILDKLEAAGWLDSQTKSQLTLVFQEAVANGLEHGNLELQSKWREEIDSEGNDKFTQIKRQRLADPIFANRTVRITSEFRDQTLQIVIRDDGPGFSPPTAEQLERARNANRDSFGRGLAIMISLMDRVCFNDVGTEVRLEKCLKRSA